MTTTPERRARPRRDDPRDTAPPDGPGALAADTAEAGSADAAGGIGAASVRQDAPGGQGARGGEAASGWQSVPGGPDASAKQDAPGRQGAAGSALPPRTVPRWARWSVVPLLVLVPLTYMLISAEQSRGAGADSQKQATARHLTWMVPSEMQRGIYMVPIPDGTVHDGYLETNSWNVSTLYCQFTTTAGGLDTFLADLGTSRAALQDGKVSISVKQARQVGWDFQVPRHHWAGMSTSKAGDKPDHDITVDLTRPDTPVVYVVSTINFQHDLGNGWLGRLVK